MREILTYKKKLWVGRIIIMKMIMLPKVIYRFKFNTKYNIYNILHRNRKRLPKIFMKSVKTPEF